MEASDEHSFQLLDRERNQPIHQWVYSVLRMNIVRLHLRPGQEVSETEISLKMGVSRTPVREAFIRLGEDGLLEVKPQRCSVISRIDLEQAEETRFVRRSLEKSITKEACISSLSSITDILSENIKNQETYAERKDFERLLAIDDEFHRAIYRSCGKERIWMFIKKLDNSHDRLRIMTLPLIAERIVDEHRSILNLLISHETDKVDEIVDKHLTNTVISKVILEYPAEYFKQDPRSYTHAPILVD